MNGYLGRRPPTKDDRDITFASIKGASPGLALPTPPANFGHGSIYRDGEDPRIDWDMNGNGPDETVAPGFQGAGDCVLATAGHIVREINKVYGHRVVITGKESISDYSAITDYVLGDNSTDNGTGMRDMMKYWQHTGILDAAGNRHKIGAYVSINPNDIDELWEATYLLSAVAIGFNFQQAQDDQFASGTWDYQPGQAPIGGHAIPLFGRNRGRGGVVSWAKHLWITRSFVEHLVDEAWAFVTTEELHNGKTERGMDLSQLDAALNALP